MKSVRFIRGYAPYNPGEIAGFPEEEANRLIKLKLAVDAAQEEPKQEEASAEETPEVDEEIQKQILPEVDKQVRPGKKGRFK